MKSKTTLIILVVVFILIVLIARRRSQTAPIYTSSGTTESQSTNNDVMEKNTASIDTDLQSLNNIIDGINNEDFASATLDGIE